MQGLQLSALLQASSTQNLLGTFGHPQTSPIFSQAREIREQSVFSEDVGALSLGTQLPLRAIFKVIIPRTSSPPRGLQSSALCQGTWLPGRGVNGIWRSITRGGEGTQSTPSTAHLFFGGPFSSAVIIPVLIFFFHPPFFSLFFHPWVSGGAWGCPAPWGLS